MWRPDSPVQHGLDHEHSRAINPLLQSRSGALAACLEASWPPEFHLLSLRATVGGWQALVRVAYYFHGSPRDFVKAGGVRLFPQDAIDSACSSAEARLADELAKPKPEPRAKPTGVSLEELGL